MCSFGAWSTIDLSRKTVILTGTVAFSCAGNAAVTSTSLNFAASNVGGVLTGTATAGGLSQSGALTAAGGNFTTSGTQTSTEAHTSEIHSPAHLVYTLPRAANNKSTTPKL